MGSVERVNLAECAEVRFDMGAAPLSSPPGRTSPTSEKRELLTNAINEQLRDESPEVRSQYLNLILETMMSFLMTNLT